MNMKFFVAAILGSSLILTACSKKEQAPAADQAASAAVDAPVTAEQQAIIAELDQPTMTEETDDASAASAAHEGH